MPDLEPQISAWRAQMLAAGIQSPVPLDELESHLRDDLEHRVKSGSPAENAFPLAVKQIGQTHSLKKEFKKIERNIMKKAILITAGILGVAVGMAFVMPAVAQYRDQGALSLDEKWLLPLGLILTVGGLGAGFVGFKKRHA